MAKTSRAITALLHAASGTMGWQAAAIATIGGVDSTTAAREFGARTLDSHVLSKRLRPLP